MSRRSRPAGARRTGRLPLLAAALLCPVLALAQAAPEDESVLFQDIPSVFAASKYEQKLSEAPAAVSIVTAEEIRNYGHRNLADVLRSVRGFYTSYDRAYTYPGLRGFNRLGDYNTRLLLLIDGYRVNDNIFEQAFIGNETIIDIDMIDRVEIVRGTGSSLYGTNAFFATINVITKRGRDYQGGEIGLEAGDHDSWKGRLSYGGRFDSGLEALASFAAYDRAGAHRLYYPEFDTPADNNGIAEDGDGERYGNFLLNLSWRDWSLQAAAVEREKKLPTAAYGSNFNDPRNEAADPRQHYVNLRYEHDLAREASVFLRLGYNGYRYQGTYLYGSDVDVEYDYGKWWTGEALLRYLPNERHRIILGLEGQYNAHAYQSSSWNGAYVLEDDRTSSRFALYAQDEFFWREDLILNLGLRHDRYDTFGGATNPRLALIYIHDADTYKLTYGTAFRAPNVYELYYNDGNATQKANPDLRPEKIKTAELIWERQLNRQLRGLLSAFRYQVSELISLVTDPDDGLLVYRNLEEVTATGMEMELEGKALGIDGRVSYAYQESEDSLTGEALVNSPAHLAKLNAGVPLLGERLHSGIELQYSSGKRTRLGGTAGSHAIVNWSLLSTNLIRGLDASFTVYNLFDKEYADPVGYMYTQDTIPQDGRGCRLKLEYEF